MGVDSRGNTYNDGLGSDCSWAGMVDSAGFANQVTIRIDPSTGPYDSLVKDQGQGSNSNG